MGSCRHHSLLAYFGILPFCGSAIPAVYMMRVAVRGSRSYFTKLRSVLNLLTESTALFCGRGVSTGLSVMRHMFSWCKNHQVARVIIMFIAIPMMDYLFPRQQPAKHLLHDPSMFKDICPIPSSRYMHSDIPVIIRVFLHGIKYNTGESMCQG
jgi:hypothetical protein